MGPNRLHRLALSCFVVGTLTLFPVAASSHVTRDVAVGGVEVVQQGWTAAERGQKSRPIVDHWDGPENLQSAPEAEMMDIADLASSDGIELTAAAEKYGKFDEFAILRDAIALEFTAEYVDGAWGSGEGVIYTVGRPSLDLLRRVTDSRLAVSVLPSPVPVSHEALMRVIDETWRAVEEFAPGSELILGEDPSVIQVRLRGPNPGVTNMRAVEASIPEALRIEWLTGSVQEPELHDNVLRGGAFTVNGSCLTSFVLTHSSGVAARMGTAAHCVAVGQQVSYRLHSVDGGTSTTLNVLESGGNTVDIALLSHGGWNGKVATFYADEDVKRMVYSRQILLPSVHDPVCHFRRVDGSQCSWVYARRYAAGWWTVITIHDRAEGGDSGGPWYYANRAYGVHNGSFPNWDGAERAFFTPVQHYSDRWNYEVLVGH